MIAGQRLAASAASMPERAALVEIRAHRPSRVELVLRTGDVLFVPESSTPTRLGQDDVRPSGSTACWPAFVEGLMTSLRDWFISSSVT